MSQQSGSLLLLVAISVVNSAAQILMRWGGAHSARSVVSTATKWQWAWDSRWWLVGILVGWIAGLGWAWCLRKLTLGLAVPIYAGLVYLLSVLGGAYFLKERISPTQALGIAAILAGICLLALSSAPQPGFRARP